MAKDLTKPGYGTAPADPSELAWAAPLMAVERFRDAAGLIDVIRLLLVCRTAAERRLVGACEWQGRPPSRVAAGVGMTPCQAADVLASVRARANAAVARHERECRLAAAVLASGKVKAIKQRPKPTGAA
jgi:hypothetical protein